MANRWWAQMTPEQIAKKEGCSFCKSMRVNRGSSNEVTAESQSWVVIDIRVGRGKASFTRKLRSCPSCHDQLLGEIQRIMLQKVKSDDTN